LELKHKGEISRIKSFVFYNLQLPLLGWWTQTVLYIGNRGPQVSTKLLANWYLKRRKLSRNKFYTESCGVQCYYTACRGKFLPNFRENVSAPPPRVKNTNIQGDSGGICNTLGNDSMCDSKEKSSYELGSDFGRLRSYDRLKLRIEGNDYW